MFKCKYCSTQIILEDVAKHSCFINKEKEIHIDDDNNFVYNDELPEDVADVTAEYLDYEILEESDLERDKVDDNEGDSRNNAESFKKSSAIWTKDATLSLLSMYETNIDKPDHKNKKTQLWQAISAGLKSIDLPFSPDQVKWKMNALLSKYKLCYDNNSRSGRDYKTCDFYDIIDEIMQKKNKGLTAASFVRSSNPLKSIKNSPTINLSSKSQSTDKSHEYKSANKKKINNEKKSDTACSTDPATSKNTTLRGTGSKIARQKVALEQEWLKHLEISENKTKADAEFREKNIKQKSEHNKLKKQYFQLRTKELEQKREMETKKLKFKQRRHDEVLEVIKSLRQNTAKEQEENGYDSD